MQASRSYSNLEYLNDTLIFSKILWTKCSYIKNPERKANCNNNKNIHILNWLHFSYIDWSALHSQQAKNGNNDNFQLFLFNSVPKLSFLNLSAFCKGVVRRCRAELPLTWLEKLLLQTIFCYFNFVSLQFLAVAVYQFPWSKNDLMFITYIKMCSILIC